MLIKWDFACSIFVLDMVSKLLNFAMTSFNSFSVIFFHAHGSSWSASLNAQTENNLLGDRRARLAASIRSSFFRFSEFMECFGRAFGLLFLLFCPGDLSRDT